MNWFVNLSTRAKLFTSFGVIIAFLVIALASAYNGITGIQRTQKEIFAEEYANSVELANLHSEINGIRTAVLNLMLLPKAQRGAWVQEISAHSAGIEKTLLSMGERNKDEAKLANGIAEIGRVYAEYKHTRDTQVIPLINEGRLDKARQLIFGVQSERYAKINSIATDLVNYSMSEAQKHIGGSEKEAKAAISTFVVIAIVVVILSILMAAFMNSVIAKPLSEISGVADSIAGGNLLVRAPSGNRPDEVGMLAQAFGKMLDNLQRQTRDIMEAVNVLASASSEIAATTAQLASGTEQTSVAVTETTTTVEEVKHTANASSQKARHVSELAQNAVSVSQNGAKLVSETIEGINNIKEQMEYIAETIVRLSEHNQAISEIISTVDDLAEQSNLLAVNASIEASKAGEHGKGFIVVAQEIRNLAEQSKQATKQVRTILYDIQKASTAAVMATEKGSKAVENNVRQSSGTGDAIKELSKSISEASQAVLQIAASNQQQLVGMDQVALAMINIKQASAQNAASTKQVELTVRNLQDLGLKLKKMVEHYRV